MYEEELDSSSMFRQSGKPEDTFKLRFYHNSKVFAIMTDPQFRGSNEHLMMVSMLFMISNYFIYAYIKAKKGGSVKHT
jgi:hypothetical protein